MLPEPGSSPQERDSGRNRLNRPLALQILFFFLLFPVSIHAWGRAGHETIARLALDPNRFPAANFFTSHSLAIIDFCYEADRRKLGHPDEGMCHYFEADAIGLPLHEALALSRPALFARFGHARLRKIGILPWAITRTREELLRAMKEGNTRKSVALAGDLAHYVADLSVPLHLTRFSQGYPGEDFGVHHDFESRLFERVRPRLNLAPFLPRRIPNEPISLLEFIEKATPEAHRIIRAHGEAREVDPTRGASFMARFEEKLKGLVEERIGLAAELLASIYFSIDRDLAAMDEKGNSNP